MGTCRGQRHGITLIELLVVFAIVGIVVAALGPAISAQLVRRIDKAHQIADIQNSRNLLNAATAMVVLESALDPLADSDGDGIYVFDRTTAQGFRDFLASWPIPLEGASDFQVRIDTQRDTVSVVLIDDEEIPLQAYDPSTSSFVEPAMPTGEAA
jgi:prepilin-type N-terminal cleavage/methylation domain-containing protein